MDAKTGMSKKTAMASTAIASIAASNDWKTQAFIATVAVVAIGVQAFVDHRKTSL